MNVRRSLWVQIFAASLLATGLTIACGGDDDTSDPLVTVDASTDATTDTSVADTSVADTGTTETDSGTNLDSGPLATDSGPLTTDGGTCTASDLDMTAAALTVAVGAGNVSLSSPAPANGFYNVTTIKKPDAAALGTNYRGLLAFTATSIFLTEQWDNGPVVKRKASYVVTNGAFVITPLCGDFPGSHTWKFYYDDGAPDAGGDGKKRVRVILPGLSSDKGYELNLTKTI